MSTRISPERDGDAALRVRDLSKAFPGTLALDRVSLDVARGEILALVGHNGSGTSTLIKILAGCLEPVAGGAIEVAGRPLATGAPHASFLAGCRFVHQDLGLVDDLSVADNLSLVGGWSTRLGTIRAREARRRAADSLAALGVDVDPEQPVGELSPALRTGVAVARALQDDERSRTALLVLDEPTATLPLPEVEQLLALIRSVAGQGVGVLFVSHRLEEVLELADRVAVLRNGRNVITRAARDLTHAELVTTMLGYELEHVEAPAAPEEAGPGGGPSLEVEDLCAGVLEQVSFAVRPGRILGIAGIEGSGRDDLLPAIFGAIERRDGRVRVRGELVADASPRGSIEAGMAYVPGDREHLAALNGLTARENVTVAELRPLSSAGRIRGGAERAEVGHWFERLEVRPEGALEAPFESFSGGNRQKLVMARSLRCEPAVLLLEEPSQGVDVGAQARLHREVVEFAAAGGAVVLSSADTDELARLCHRVLVLQRGEIAAELRDEQVSDESISHALLSDGRKVAA